MNILSLSECVDRLRKNLVIAYPTESVLGLGCNPESIDAVKVLLKLKKRKLNKGFILVASHFNQIRSYISESKLSIYHKKILYSSWPDTITYLLPAKSFVPDWLTGRSNFLGIRISAHNGINKLCSAFGKAIISTSANISGRNPCRTYEEFLKQFGTTVPILCGPLGTRKNPSKILNIINGSLIRHG
ncbi:conserved hypothetical protein [Buchnera aphidicola str. Bp (Baizongia pistaciae)]|uniref:Threonylcarbamoyl-AMP synthase n=1 Tax=Buchnera aphidicola subsp. Baizongia pistaciae (strain Bp) TaxID=224915 RepID=TSAC_BUCBP|nr:L-threonylcarbamoyladenylate synthase type 1 TsaC [Buchnera aphidicola]Q89A89.1 RecName: Full=Threonylcarbamoyl-AMP synthase; Short=TC-AMP synthase; AltName: Full=L-threonylcarbamoyladenylate synthase; AltName: Full=t(6)A37 threonylcarbamoyladenosine biosynthesis protein TsaC; AltName: Full=tRNA threonylcarbamoyladenosine biosynthesis protein TsaC [Buchnera aphidicola str. Bp (Baizongia pistaciae)]AAO27144.1 conserved hypothetical protein [Buchnera aphidicola str. Bp (Baizongia pistaciae)]